ncbi:MAG TPA: pirin family protein [Trebonia sp.]|nr:pirin family protein [Trebonia sp.]
MPGSANPSADTRKLLPVRRAADRVTDKVRLGKDGQVDDKAMVIQPSYAGYPSTDPFIALSEDWMSSPGFDWHPHRGVETVTVVLDGVLEHGDSLGNAGTLTPGDAQWMTAGRGIIHREHGTSRLPRAGRSGADDVLARRGPADGGRRRAADPRARHPARTRAGARSGAARRSPGVRLPP